MPELLAFVGVSLAVIVAPGPDFALTLRNTLSGGQRAGWATGGGVALGQVVWAAAVAAGLSTVLAASELLFTALRLAGAAYLVALGLASLAAAFRRDGTHPALEPWRGALPPRRAFRQGLLSDLSNPKMLAFFTGLLPSFAPADGPTFVALLALGVLFAALTLLWLAVCVSLVNLFRRALARTTIRRALDAAVGAVLVALGVRVAID